MESWFGFCGHDAKGEKMPAYVVWEISLEAALLRMAATYPGADFDFIMSLRGTTEGANMAPGKYRGEIQNKGSWVIPNWPGLN